MNFQTLIDCPQLADLLDHVDCLVFDCRFDLADVARGEQAYRESHIPGALYAHLDHDLSSPITPESGRHPLPGINGLVEWLGRCGMREDRQVVVYDDSYGTMAARLWWLLKCLGHRRVAVLDGGWQAWIAVGYPVNDHVVKPQPVNYSAQWDEHQVVTTDQVEKNLEASEFLLVDVRTPERFQGISEPIDPVAGHIPGAVNIPLTDNLDAQGRFKRPVELRELYAEVLANHDPTRQVYMCGSGVTACHSLVALSHAGETMPRVYAGSWSEWIRDPERPVALLSSSGRTS